MKPESRTAMVLACLTYAAVAMVYWLFANSPFISPFEDMQKDGLLRNSLQQFWATGVLHGREMFFVGDPAGKYQEIIDWILGKSDLHPFTTLDTFVGVAALAGQYFSDMLNLQYDLQLLVIAGTLWVVTRQLGMEVERCCAAANNGHCGIPEKNVLQHRLTWNDVRLKYNSTRELANLINQVFGWNYGFYFAISVLFNSISLDEIFVPKTSSGSWQVALFLLYISLTSLVILTCADICTQVGTANYKFT